MSRNQRGRIPLPVVLAVLAFLAAVVFLLFFQGDSAGLPGNESPDAGLGYRSSPERPAAGLDAGAAAPARREARSAAPTPMVLASRVRGRILDPQGKGVEGAKVVLTERFANPVLVLADAKNFGVYSRTTNETGFYVFDDLPLEKDFNMWVYHPDFAATQGIPVTPIKGEDQDMPPIVLDPGYRIGGKVTDAAGLPLRATVEVRMQQNEWRPGTEEDRHASDLQARKAVTVKTNENGDYVIDRLAKGIWVLEARAPGYATAKVDGVVLLEERQDTYQNLKLGKEEILGGHIRDENGQPVEGVKVFASRLSPRPPIQAQAVTDSQGDFVVRGLEKGIYGMGFQSHGYSHKTLQRIPSGKTDIEVVLRLKGGVSGRVTLSDGRPATRFTLEVRKVNRNSSTFGFTGVRKTVEDDNGNYVLQGLDPGSYILLAATPGQAPTYSTGFRVQRTMVRGVDIQLKAGGRITGYVFSAASGSPLPGAQVILRGTSFQLQTTWTLIGEGTVDPNNVPRISARADREGKFDLPHAFPGRVQVEVRHPTHLSQLIPVTVEEGGTTDLGTIQLRTGGSVVGTAYDSAGKPLAGGFTYLTRAPESGPGFFSQNRTLDARGRFRFDALPAGTYLISATSLSDEGWGFLGEADDSEQKIYVAEGQTVTVNLRLP